MDERGVRLVHGMLYWFWVVRDLNTGRVVAVRLSETRTGLDVMALFQGGVGRGGGPPRRRTSAFLRTSEFLTVKFGRRSNRPSGRLNTSGMDGHFPWNARGVCLDKGLPNVYNLQGE